MPNSGPPSAAVGHEVDLTAGYDISERIDEICAALGTDAMTYEHDDTPEGALRRKGWEHGTVERIATDWADPDLLDHFKGLHNKLVKEVGYANHPEYMAAYLTAREGPMSEPPKGYTPTDLKDAEPS